MLDSEKCSSSFKSCSDNPDSGSDIVEINESDRLTKINGSNGVEVLRVKSGQKDLIYHILSTI